MHPHKARDIVLKALHKTARTPSYVGSLCLTDHHGQRHLFEGQGSPQQKQQSTPKAHMHIHELSVLTRFLMEGQNALIDDYQHGLWDSDNLLQLVEWVLRNHDIIRPNILKHIAPILWGKMLYRLSSSRDKNNTRRTDTIPPMGNDFYALWLDKGMSYSCALFDDAHESLEQAQNNKYRHILEFFGDKPLRLLDIGSGWGSFALHAIRHAQHHVTAVTIGQEEHAYAKKRLTAYPDHATLRLQDYQDIDGCFDGIVSIEMCQYVRETHWNHYFRKIRELLTPEGIAFIQSFAFIHKEDMNRYHKNIGPLRLSAHPESVVPRIPYPATFLRQAQQEGLVARHVMHHGTQYGRTIQAWLQRFDAAYSSLQQMGYPDHFIRLWYLYLASWGASFCAERSDVIQVVLTRHKA
ncbi:MAG: class I SAM-dependent methyltransferase [Alphaproteobacteria bacterium GM7ARS4]|nr:class I SAM-dependent methyltransferase [Alphaproteobacteria bacterium GM7ARS4]